MNVLEDLNIPLIQSKRIPVKLLIEQSKPTPENKKILESSIASMYLVSILNEQTIRIRSYKDDNFSYQSIYVFIIELKQDNNINTLAHLVHSAFPEPTLLLFRYKTINYVSAASKRINKIEQNKTVVEESITTQLTSNIDNQLLDISLIKEKDLYDYYNKLITWIYKLKVLSITGVYPNQELDFKLLLKQYDELKSNINKLKEDYKVATMTSDKIRIDDDLYESEVQIYKLIERLL